MFLEHPLTEECYCAMQDDNMQVSVILEAGAPYVVHEAINFGVMASMESHEVKELILNKVARLGLTSPN